MLGLRGMESVRMPSWPLRQPAGQASPYLSTYWKASMRRRASSTLRPTERSLIVICGRVNLERAGVSVVWIVR